MKKIFLSVMLIVLGLAAQAEEQLVSLLTQNKAICRDEMFTFQVTYSDISTDGYNFRFTTTMLHKEELGQYKVSIICSLPWKLVKEAKREVLTNNGIGKNTFVRLYLSREMNSSAILITTEITDSEGKVKTETRGPNSPNIEIYFPDQKAAQTWNEELTKYLNKR